MDSTYLSELQSYLSLHYKFANYILSSQSLAFTARDPYSPIYLQFRISLHPSYNLPTLYFQLHLLAVEDGFLSDTVTFDSDVLHKYVNTRHGEFVKKIAAAQSTTNFENSRQQPTNLSRIAIDNKGYYYLHPCQLHQLSYEKDHAWTGLFLSCLGIY